MNLSHILPFISTGITLLFAGTVLSRYLKRRRPHLLLWGLGLGLYAAGTFTEAYLALQWSEPGLRIWYLTGAMLTAAWLAQGTVYLLVRKPALAHGLMAGLGLLSVIALFTVFTTPVEPAAFKTGVALSSQYKAILTPRPPLMILLTILLNLYGTLILVGGAVWSAWLFWRKRVLPNRMLGNIFIAVGALFPAAAGTLVQLGLGDWLYLSELIGAGLMFIGFQFATREQVVNAPVPA